MARAHYFYYLINSAGEPIPNANISIYSAGTTTPAQVYFGETGGASVSTIPQTNTDTNGFFQFWIADASEGGYEATSKFDVSWSTGGGAEDGTLQYIDFITPRPISMSTTSIPTSAWTADDGQYYYDVVHGLGNSYPVVMLYEVSTNTETVPTTATSISANTTRVWKIDDAASVVSILG